MRICHIIIISYLKNSILFPQHVPCVISTSDKLFAARFGVQKKSRDHETFCYKVNRVIGLKIEILQTIFLIKIIKRYNNFYF